MLQNDASQAGSATDARNDSDVLNQCTGPESGNVISGAGTISGAAGADVLGNAPGQVVAVNGTEGAGGTITVQGAYGTLVMQGDGSYSYTRNADAPDGVSDVFNYTLADAAGARDNATLTIELRCQEEEEKAQQLLTTPDGVVMLPAGVELSDIRVVGRDLVITLPDGSTMTIPNGAVFVPQLVIGDVEVPPTNLAALLIDAEPQPASGDTPQSSGGNFEVDVPPLDPGVPLGDLIPPTEMDYTPPTFEEVGQIVDRDPEIVIQPDGQPASVAAIDSVDERGLPTRNGGEPAGSGEVADGNSSNNSDTSETTTGLIIYSAPDGLSSISLTVNGVTTVITAVGQVIAGQYGNLTITSIAPGQIGYSYTLRDNTSGNATADNFSVTVTETDGDVATATLRIDIVDDVPVARPDTDSIAAGQFGPATGNVITDAAAGDAGDSDNGADTVGADNASLTSVSGAGGSDSTFENGVLVVNGQYGVLTIAANGDYSYVRNAGTPGGVQDVFNYTITDGDGDPSTSTLTISIGDTTPQTGANATVLLDDDAQPGGNPGGVGDDVDAANTSGTLAGSGGDGALTFDLLTTGAPAGFTYVDGPNGSVLVQQSGVTVLTVTINPATGAYTVVQNAAIDHPAGGDENNLGFTINYTVTDADGDSAPGTLSINVDDDTPIITRTTVAAPTLLVDETDLAANASGDFSGLFTVSYGADGAGSTSYAVAVVNGTDSGLVDVASGDAILLFNNNGVVEGRVGGEGGAVAFTVSINSATGVVTLDQVRALDHPDATNPDDPVSPNATSIQMTVSALDGDGDPVSQTVNIGSSLVFEDDGPSISNVVAAGGVLLDETEAGSPAGFPISETSASAVVTATTAYGADGAGTTVYGLSLTGGVMSLASGLATAVGDNPITLVQVDANTIEGRYNGTDVAFTIEMNADGTITVTQEVPLEHLVDGPPGPAHDDPLDLAGLVDATVTVTDRDGDSVTGSAAIGDNIVFEDDGPSIDVVAGADAGVVLLTDDADTLGASSDTATSQANFSGVFSATFVGGADGAAGNPVFNNYALGVSQQGVDSGLNQSGANIYLYLINGVVVGSTSATLAGVAEGNTVFDVQVDASGAVTLTQYSQIDHPIAGDPDATDAPFADHIISMADELVTLSATGTVTDNDGDTATDSATINIGANLQFSDDGPDIAAVLTGNQIRIDETDGVTAPGEVDPVGGNLGTVTVSAATLFTVTNLNVSADAPTTLSYALTLSSQGVDSGLQVSSNDAPIYLYSIGGVVYGSTSATEGGVTEGNTAFTVSIDESGSVTVTQFLAIEHGNTASNDEDSPSFDPNVLNVTITATDFDGDTDTASVDLGSVIVFEDDGPSATQNQSTGTVDEDGVVEGGADGGIGDGIAGGPDDVAGESTVATGSVTALFNSGSDAPLSYSLSANTAGLPALTSNGFAVTYAVVGNTLTASANGETVFTFSLTADGNWTFTLVDQIDHPTLNGLEGDNTENELSIALGSIVQATDADGDTVTALANGVVITVDDDTPVARNDTDAIVSGGNTATGNVVTGAGTTSGVAGADSTGADAPATVTAISGSGGTDTTFSAGLLTITGDHGFIEIDANGQYTYTRTDMTPGNYNDQFTYTYTDADGDSVTATLTISISDNAPVLVTPGPVQLDDDNALGVVGNPGGPGDDDVSGTSGTLSASGGDGDIDYFFAASQTAPAGFTYNQVNATTLQILQGATVIATVTLNNETGDYTVVQNNPVQHETLNGMAGDNTENNTPNFNVAFYSEDADGDDSNIVNLIINIDDDTPENNDTVLAPLTVHEDALNTVGAVGNSEGGQTTTASISVASLITLVDPGADTPITIGLNVAIDGMATGLTQRGTSIVWDVVSATQINGVVDGTSTVVFTLVRNGSNYDFTLVDNIDHNPSGAGDADIDNLSLANVFTATDNDGDTIVIDAGASINIQNDVPLASTTQLTGTVDEDGVVENAAPGVQRGDGIAGGPGDFAGQPVTASGNVSALFLPGADGPLTYQLTNASSLNSLGLTSGGTPLTYQITVNLGVYTLTASANGGPVFTLTLDSTTGAYLFTLEDQLDHPTLNGQVGDNTENELLINLSSVIRAVDTDGDAAPAGANGLVITVDDDSPMINAVDATLNIDNDATPSGTGVFDFDIGADENFDFDDIVLSNFTVTVNGAAATNVILTPGAETASTANYTFSFQYNTGQGNTATATGTLVFDKDAGTYTATLTNGPIQGFSILDTGSADASAFVNYNPDGTISNGPSNIATVALDNDFYIQFTGVAEPGSGTGADNLRTIDYSSSTGQTSGTPDAGADAGAWAAGELLNQASSTVTVSSSAAGVAGNTIQGGEVLDFNLYSTDPQSNTNGTPTQDATSMFIKLDGVGTAEDMIVILKLYDTVTGQYTTRAIIVENGDIIKSDAALTGTAYDGITLDNNDGLIVIEANDYQQGNPNLVIVGAQIAGSDEGITGTGINLNGAIGGASSGTQDFSTDLDNNPFKITSIGFLRDASEDQNAQLNFDVTLEDADGDAVTQHITVNFGDPPAMMTTASTSTKSTALVSEMIATDSLVSANDNQEQALRTMNSTTNNAALLGAVAAAGLAAPIAAEAHPFIAKSIDIPADFSGLTAQSITLGGVEAIAAGGDLAGAKSTSQVQNVIDTPGSTGGTDAPALQSIDEGDAPPESAEPVQSSDVEVPSNAASGSEVAAAAMDVGMPSTFDIATANAASVDPQSDLGQVLADALAGGTNGPDIEALLEAAGAGDGAGSGLASGLSDGVPAWDSGEAAAFNAGNHMFSMEQMAIHPDATPHSAA